MAITDKTDYLKLKKLYKGYFIEDFEEDYKNYRAIIRIVNSYIKNPNYRKAHDIYNKIIILHRVFEKKKINCELLSNCESDYKKSFLKYIFNELFKNKYKLKFLEERWEDDIEILIKNNKLCKFNS